MKKLLILIALVFSTAAVARPRRAPAHDLRVFVRPEFHVSNIAGNRVLRFEWSVINAGNADFIGPNRNINPDQFTRHFGLLAVANAWSLTLLNEVQGLGIEHTGSAFLLWDYQFLSASPARFRNWSNTGITGISPYAEAFAPGFYTSYPLEGIPDGDYFAIFVFDPLNLWGARSYAEPFWIHIEALSAVPIRLDSPP